MSETKKRVDCFGGTSAEGNGSMRNLLGGKGANLAEMCTLGMPVPAGFTITTECTTFPNPIIRLFHVCQRTSKKVSHTMWNTLLNRLSCVTLLQYISSCYCTNDDCCSIWKC